MKRIIIISILTIISCNKEDLKDFGYLKVQGVDRFGQQRVCYQNANETCTEAASIEEEHFANNCQANGNTPHKCSCNEFVCDIQTYEGIDKDGNIRSCTQIPQDSMCTMEFTDSDQFAMDCEEDGKLAIQCGCHDYICVDTIGDNNETTEQFGTNQDGVQRSCVPMSNDIICDQSLNQVQIYAQNCRSEGFDTTWCSCHEVLCLDQ